MLTQKFCRVRLWHNSIGRCKSPLEDFCHMNLPHRVDSRRYRTTGGQENLRHVCKYLFYIGKKDEKRLLRSLWVTRSFFLFCSSRDKASRLGSGGMLLFSFLSAPDIYFDNTYFYIRY